VKVSHSTHHRTIHVNLLKGFLEPNLTFIMHPSLTYFGLGQSKESVEIEMFCWLNQSKPQDLPFTILRWQTLSTPQTAQALSHNIMHQLTRKVLLVNLT
jgi:hypothetical protein